MKKIITILLAVMLMILPMTTAFAADEIVEFNFGSDITGTLNKTTGVLTISGTGPMTSFGFDSPATYNNDFIKTVIIEEGIQTIGYSAFYMCYNLTSVSLPEGVLMIDVDAFSECSALSSVTLSDGLLQIRENAFKNCMALSSITIPSTVNVIGKSAFSGSNLSSITIPEGVTSIAEDTFTNCTHLLSVTIPSTVTTIGDSAFEYCSRLKTITNLYNGVQTIGVDALKDAGSYESEKTAMVVPYNTSFATAATEAGYTLSDLPAKATGNGLVETTVPVTGNISAMVVSVTHPTSIEYAINPDLGHEDAFIAPDIAITNNTKVPINVTIKTLESTKGGELEFTDVAADAKNWAKLNKEDSKKYIALGIKIKNETNWNAGHNTNTRYAVDSGETYFGSLAKNATGYMSIVANHGLAFDQNYTSKYNLVFQFDLT